MRSPREYESPLCAQIGGDVWFPEKADSAAPAKKICGSCIHKIECAEWGIKHEQFGVWGGLSPRDRHLARRRLNIILERLRIEDWLC